MSVIADLNGAPPLVAAALEVVTDRPAHGAGDEVPADGHAASRDRGDLGEGLLAEVHVALLALGAAVHDLDGHRPAGSRGLDAGPADCRVGVVDLVHRRHHQIGGLVEAAVTRAIRCVVRALALVQGHIALGAAGASAVSRCCGGVNRGAALVRGGRDAVV